MYVLITKKKLSTAHALAHSSSNQDKTYSLDKNHVWKCWQYASVLLQTVHQMAHVICWLNSQQTKLN